MKQHFRIAALLLVLNGCATNETTPQPLSPRPPELTPVEIVGPYIHEASGAVFPPDQPPFRRISIFKRGPEGQRVTAGYAGGPPECLVALTIFLDPAEEAGRTEKAFARAKEEVVHAFPNAIHERDSETRGGVARRRADFLIEDRRMEVGVRQERGAWDIKHRAIYPAKCREEANKLLDQFLPGWGR